MGLRDRLRKLERDTEGDMLLIPQKDGTVARFSREAYMECLLHEMDRGGQTGRRGGPRTSAPAGRGATECREPGQAHARVRHSPRMLCG